MNTSLYSRLPSLLQHAACSAYGLRERRHRFGSEFRRLLSAWIKSDFADRQRIQQLQDAQIAHLVASAYECSPHYRLMMDKAGLIPRDIQQRADLAALPILTKEEVRKYGASLATRCAGMRQLRTAATSGSTGTPLTFPISRQFTAAHWAIWWRHRYRFGISPGERHVNFTGKPVVPMDQDTAPYWRYNLAMNQLVVGMQHISEAKVPELARAISRWKPVYWSGYPSIISSFCYVLEELGIEIESRPHAVFLGAEGADCKQRSLISRVTGALVTDQYGFSEGAGNASRCPQGNYHEDWEFGILEPEEEPASSQFAPARPIIGTGFWNSAFPFIRYKTGDLAVWADSDERCPCGRHSRVIRSIEGREEDYVVTPDAKRISRFDYLFKGATWLREAQVVQTSNRDVVVLAVVSRSPSEYEVEKVRASFRAYISLDMNLTIRCVDEIPRTASGKFRAVVSLKRWQAEGAD